MHRFDKHFFDHEVVKTGQYRDHQIEDVLDQCFVMFITRFNKGRPRGFPLDKDVYVCESRYNEEKFTFNKIKTWASCVPDEVREKDYEMDLFEAPRRMKKVPSPIKHLLREDAKETDDLPKPTWGSPNAPPIVGAVHRRPREINVSTKEPASSQMMIAQIAALSQPSLTVLPARRLSSAAQPSPVQPYAINPCLLFQCPLFLPSPSRAGFSPSNPNFILTTSPSHPLSTPTPAPYLSTYLVASSNFFFACRSRHPQNLHHQCRPCPCPCPQFPSRTCLLTALDALR